MHDLLSPFIAHAHEQLRILLDVLITGVLVSFLGLERERADKPAGLKTNIIVGSFSCAIVSVSFLLVEHFSDSMYSTITRSDPIRVVEAIVVGISFIGAGTIIKSRDKTQVYYLTTSATLLFSGAIGITVALHQYILALGLAIFGTVVNLLFKKKVDDDKVDDKREHGKGH